MTQPTPTLPPGLTIQGRLAHLDRLDRKRFGWYLHDNRDDEPEYIVGGNWDEHSPTYFSTAEAAIEFACLKADLPPGFRIERWRVPNTPDKFLAIQKVEQRETILANCDSALAAYLEIAKITGAGGGTPASLNTP